MLCCTTGTGQISISKKAGISSSKLFEKREESHVCPLPAWFAMNAG